MGFRVKEEKKSEGHCIGFLGIEINTQAMEACMPPGKHEKATALVKTTLAQVSVTRRSLETSVYFFSFASQVVRVSRPLLRRLYDALTATSRTHLI
jgi:hypothetical protein